MAQRRIDWDAIKTEYVTTDISQRGLIKKYKLVPQDLAKHSKNEGWVKLRKEYREKTTAKTIAKISCKESSKRAKELESLLASTSKLISKIEKTMDDPDQFNRYVVQYGHDKEFDTEERVYMKADTRAMKDLAQTIKSLEGSIRSLNNINTLAEEQRLRIERERWELEQKKFEREQTLGKSDDKHLGVILIPEIEVE